MTFNKREMGRIKRRNRWICIGTACLTVVILTATVFAEELDMFTEYIAADAKTMAVESEVVEDIKAVQEQSNDLNMEGGSSTTEATDDTLASDSSGSSEEANADTSQAKEQGANETGSDTLVSDNNDSGVKANADTSQTQVQESGETGSAALQLQTLDTTEADLDNGLGVAQMPQFINGIIPKGSNEDLVLSEEELLEILGTVSNDTNAARLSVVLKAYALQDEVSYFWGGKSTAFGWDERWGNETYVTSEGSSTTGTLRTFGLDCSGYVNWVFNNAVNKDVTSKVGSGTTNQWAKSVSVDWDDAQPGDLAFFYNPSVAQHTNHVGVVVGWNEEGQLMVAHCSSSRNNVVVTEAKATGFVYIRTPNIYNDEDYTARVAENTSLNDYTLWLNTEEVEWEEVQSGDIVFDSLSEAGTDRSTGVVTRVDKNGNILVSYSVESGSVVESVESGVGYLRRAVNKDNTDENNNTRKVYAVTSYYGK